MISRRLRILAPALVALLAFPGPLAADDIANNLDSSVDASYESMALNVGGAAQTAILRVVTRNGDGKSGCNLTGSTTLVVNVGSSNNNVATVTPGQLTFDSCGATRQITVQPVAEGSSLIFLSLVSNNSGGTFQLATAAFLANVGGPANTAPVVKILGVTNGASYEIGNVPAATCEVTDAEDGSPTVAATYDTSGLDSNGLGLVTAHCSYTDSGGLKTEVTATYSVVDTTKPVIVATVSGTIKDGFDPWFSSPTVGVSWSVTDNVLVAGKTGCDAVTITDDVDGQVITCSATDESGNSASESVTIYHDATAPTITGEAAPAANAAGWNNSAVTVSFTCSDATSGVDETLSKCADQTFSDETLAEGVTAIGSVTDKAGNFAGLEVGPIKIDLTNPDISAALDKDAASSGWFNIATGAPTVSFTCADLLSGIASCPASHEFGNGKDQSYSGTAYDAAGNSADAGVTDVNVDLIAPSLNITGAPSTMLDVCSAAPSRPSFAPEDTGSSGLATSSDSWTTPSTASGVGTYTYTANAADYAGNSTSETRTYTVAYGGAFSGYLQPINPDGTSRFKLGSTVPVKFRLTCNGVPISSAVAKLYVAKGDSIPDPGIDEAISTSAATTGNLFRYDASAGQYIFNLSTKSGYVNPTGPAITAFSQGSWTLKILLDDGTWRSINIQLVR